MVKAKKLTTHDQFQIKARTNTNNSGLVLWGILNDQRQKSKSENERRRKVPCKGGRKPIHASFQRVRQRDEKGFGEATAA